MADNLKLGLIISLGLVISVGWWHFAPLTYYAYIITMLIIKGPRIIRDVIAHPENYFE